MKGLDDVFAEHTPDVICAEHRSLSRQSDHRNRQPTNPHQALPPIDSPEPSRPQQTVRASGVSKSATLGGWSCSESGHTFATSAAVQQSNLRKSAEASGRDLRDLTNPHPKAEDSHSRPSTSRSDQSQRPTGFAPTMNPLSPTVTATRRVCPPKATS